ncbi:MAG: metallophosphoesterase [Pirellulaceae bacterium]|nr:metallophosphoesterase [Pirellulaceae bacterium]
MTRLAWCTDIHLNFAQADTLAGFLQRLRATDPDIVLVGGDIAEATDVVHFLQLLDDFLQRPIYFVLGNHDFYFGSIAGVRHDVRTLCDLHPHLHYLTDEGVVRLTDRHALVGHDGWADARIGNYERSMIMMNDYKLIEELAGVTKQERWPLLQALGDEAAQAVRRVLPAALEQFEEVYLLTHVPPLREACWHNGRISDDEWAPHFTCLAVGQAVLEIMADYPHRELTVLCGHTHGSGEAHPLPNVWIYTGAAVYGFPTVNRVLVLE